MNRRLVLTLLSGWLVAASVFAEKREIHILSGNDMHAKISAFPQLAAIADSLRSLYPSLLVFSAGDNRTGEPLNDLYEIPAYPMVALMNQVGFNATTLGNHEFDSRQAGLARLIGLSNFSYLCANIHPDPELGIHCRPCQVFDVDGLKVGVVGVVQLGTHGLPDSHPDNCRGIKFSPVKETVAQYKWLRDQCNVVVLLSHIGYEDDVELSKDIPWVDLIIGGHTHTQLAGGEMHNGILITQNVNRLERVTHITLTLDDGKLIDKRAENIVVSTFPKKNKIVEEMVRFFSDNPAFRRVLCQAKTPFTTYEELGCLMSDAFRTETGADIGFVNAGGIRYDKHPAGSMTVSDVLQLDPFGNDAIELTLTGEELRQMLLACCKADGARFPSVSGITCDVVRDPNNPAVVKKVQLLTPEGKKLNLKKTYRVVTNSYAATVSDSPRKDQGRNLNRQTSELIMNYLEHQGTINYAGACRIVEH